MNRMMEKQAIKLIADLEDRSWCYDEGGQFFEYISAEYRENILSCLHHQLKLQGLLSEEKIKAEKPDAEKCPVDVLVNRAVEKWGNTSQMLLTMKECGELIAVINQFLKGRKSKFQLAGEIADVEIMCAQMRNMIGTDIVDREKQRKLCRLGERLGLYEVVYDG